MRAAKFAPGLSNKERKLLFEDAMQRLEKLPPKADGTLWGVDDVPDLDLALEQRDLGRKDPE